MNQFCRPFAWLWFGVKLVFVLCVVFFWWVGGRPARDVLRVLGQWAEAWWERLRSPQGYALFFTMVGAYFGAYAIVEARHERQVNRALFERSAFMTMVTADQQGAFVAAMKQFGSIQTMRSLASAPVGAGVSLACVSQSDDGRKGLVP